MIFHIAHLYGDLMNTYGDNGNLLMLQYVAKQQGFDIETDLISLESDFDADKYDLVFFGGGQDYEQYIVSKDLVNKAEAIKTYIENDGVTVGICGGYQLLGHYFNNIQSQHLEGVGALDVYTESDEHRLIGDITIHSDEFNETYKGYENHSGRTYLGPDMQPLGKVISGFGNNDSASYEGLRYRNTFGSYFHGPIMVRNEKLTQHIIDLAIERKAQR